MKYFSVLIPFVLLSMLISSCIPAYEVEEKMYKLEKRITTLETYRDRELKKMKKEVETLLKDNETTKEEIKELLLRTSIIGEPIEEEGMEDSDTLSDR